MFHCSSSTAGAIIVHADFSASRVILRHPRAFPGASHGEVWRDVMRKSVLRAVNSKLFLVAAILLMALPGLAQEPDGPQTMAPAAVAPPPAAPAAHAVSHEKVLLPAGTRVAVVLENGLSTRNARVGDSVYLRTSFPITQNNRIVVPIGSYVRGELLDSKRPGRNKGRGIFPHKA